MSPNRYHCELFPYIREDVFTMQQVKQALGWKITAFDLPEVWKTLGGGEGVKIGVLDTGCDEKHCDLSDNLLSSANLVSPREKPKDVVGHGTHVTGCIVAQNNEIGMVGVAPKAKVMPIKILGDDGTGDMKTVAKGIRLGADEGMDFLCLSLGCPNPIQEVRKAIQYASDKGCVIFCAAGNAGNTKQVFYPSAYSETISIGAIDEDFRRADFSCTGRELDFVAPGVKIFSTVPDNWYAFMSGTSQATPFAVGVAALVLSYKRNAGLNIRLETAQDYINLFQKHAIPTSDPRFAGKKFFEGFGIIDPRKLTEWTRSNR